MGIWRTRGSSRRLRREEAAVSWNRAESWLAAALVAYLLIVGVGAAVVMIVNLPTERANVITFSTDSGGAQQFVPFGKLGSA